MSVQLLQECTPRGELAFIGFKPNVFSAERRSFSFPSPPQERDIVRTPVGERVTTPANGLEAVREHFPAQYHVDSVPVLAVLTAVHRSPSAPLRAETSMHLARRAAVITSETEDEDLGKMRR